MGRRREPVGLVAACERGEYGTLAQSGWIDVYEALEKWWAKRFSLEDYAPYLDVLSDESPEAVMRAVRSLRGESWRPAPSALYRAVAGAAAEAQAERDAERFRQPRRLRPDQEPEVLARVRWLLADRSATVCACPERPMEVLVDSHNVLRCRKCRGIEQGQAFEAEDAAA